MKQQIKCPHCNKVFPIEESLKHEAQELRKKLQDSTVKKVAETLDALNEVTEKLKIAEEIKNESMRS